ncbi:MAG: Ribonuclease D (EC [uncultured Thiotrichaceae bacterium]|uniref:Ribonuclease D n=1 Tax=uncultured Thiotrichaceae bacterium TaxID=298394 RepID=A0A6S6U7S7_9GAMM|nr:MAG: Ribonuclease D (EC [uncultured Thiotrichaceae bacterium]
MFEYIDNSEALSGYLERVDSAKWVMLDTEFIREKTYFPKLCLIQVATETTQACIDPLAIKDLSPFFDWIYRKEMVKVFHAAWQDLEIVYQLSDAIPSSIFDTQIAAAVLGLGDQMGYARLVEQLLGVQLDKSQSRTDWSRRPLSQKQLEYAIGDVTYLRDMYPMLLQQLEESGRLSWLQKSFSHLEDATQYEPDPRGCWKRVKGVHLLKPAQLTALRELAAWREEQAIKKDLPRRWLLSDEVLIDIVRMKVADLESFQQVRGLKPEQITRNGKLWLSLIEKGQALPREEWPELPKKRKLDAQLALVADLLMVLVNQQARENNISPQMIATRSQVEKMLSEGRDNLSDDWRGSLMNEVFADLLNGKIVMRIENLQLKIDT